MTWHASFPASLPAALAAAPLFAPAALAVALLLSTAAPALAQESPQGIRLPEVRREGAMSLEAALWARRSIRDLKPDSLPLAAAAQLLWAAQGKNRPDGHRTAPSAMAAYPV